MSKNIILDPYVMFSVLNDLEEDTKNLVKKLTEIGDILQVAAKMTYAIGFGNLMDEAQDGINNVGYAAISAHNTVATNCSEVVNKLVQKFAAEAGARGNYTVAPFKEIKIQTNFPDRVHINPHYLKGMFDNFGQKHLEFSVIVDDIERLFATSDSFWQGTAADSTRQKFKRVVMPFFEDLKRVFDQIYAKGEAWVDDAIKTDASLGVQ